MPSLEDTQNYGELKKKLEKLSEKQKDIHKPLSTATKERLVRVVRFSHIVSLSLFTQIDRLQRLPINKLKKILQDGNKPFEQIE